MTCPKKNDYKTRIGRLFPIQEKLTDCYIRTSYLDSLLKRKKMLDREMSQRQCSVFFNTRQNSRLYELAIKLILEKSEKYGIKIIFNFPRVSIFIQGGSRTNI